MSWVAHWTDYFERANGNYIGNGWSQGASGYPKLVDGSVSGSTFSGAARAWRDIATTAPIEIEADLWRGPSNAGYAAIHIRDAAGSLETDGDQYVLYINGTSTLSSRLVRVSGGVSTTLASGWNTLQTTPQRLKLRVTDTLVQAYLNGVLVASVTDTELDRSTLSRAMFTLMRGGSSSTAWLDNLTINEWQDDAPPATNPIDALFFGAGL